MTTPSLAVFKQWAHDHAQAAQTVLMARVYAEMTQQRVDAYIGPIFESYGFTYGAMGNKGGLVGPIPTPKELYLAENDEKMTAYYAECDAAHRAHGFTGPQGHCPALVAEHLVRQAEWALIELAEPLFGLSLETHYLTSEQQAKYLDLLIGAAVKAGAERPAVQP